MNFYDTITEMGYHVRHRTNDCVLIAKQPYTDFLELIIFDIPNKQIHGAIKNMNLISTIDQVAIQFKEFRQLQKDVEKLAEYADYKIIK